MEKQQERAVGRAALMASAIMQQERLVPLPEVRSITGESTSNIYAKMAKGEFPKQVKLSERRVGWVASEIAKYVADKIAKRDAETAEQAAERRELHRRMVAKERNGGPPDDEPKPVKRSKRGRKPPPRRTRQLGIK